MEAILGNAFIPCIKDKKGTTILFEKELGVISERSVTLVTMEPKILVGSKGQDRNWGSWYLGVFILWVSAGVQTYIHMPIGGLLNKPSIFVKEAVVDLLDTDKVE